MNNQKILNVLDGVIKEWETLYNRTNSTVEPYSSMKKMLAHALSSIGAYREPYFSGSYPYIRLHCL